MFLQKLYNYLKTMKIQIQYNPFAVLSHPAGNEYIALKKKSATFFVQLTSESPASKVNSKGL